MAIGPWQILVIIALLLLLFGAGRLSEIGKGLGSGIRNFKQGLEGDDEEGDSETDGGGMADKRQPSPKSLPGSRGFAPTPDSEARAVASPADGGGGANEDSAATRKQDEDELA